MPSKNPAKLPKTPQRAKLLRGIQYGISLDRHMNRFNFLRMASICLFVSVYVLNAFSTQSETKKEIKVALLDVRKLEESERKTTDGISEDGVRCVFFVENAPGISHPPVLGEIRLSFAGILYNEVTNAASSKPFSPDLIIYDLEKFKTTDQIKKLIPKSRPGAVSVIIEAVIRGKIIKQLNEGTVEFELGAVNPPHEEPNSSNVEYTKFNFKLL